MKIGVLGSGDVARALAVGFVKYGHRVQVGSRTPAKLMEWPADLLEKISVGTLAEAAEHGDLIVLAVKGSAAKEALDSAGHDHLAGKIIIDPTNPIANTPPQDGVLSFFTQPDRSLLEELQAEVPNARFVKAFSCVGSPHMVDPGFDETPTMFICGNDQSAKSEVAGILHQFGWQVEDCGTAVAARAIEPLCILWCIPGMLGRGWGHAFRLLRQNPQG